MERLAGGCNPGDVGPVGEGVSELRIDHGSGCRVYYTKRGRDIIFLEACLEEADGDAAFIAKALGDIARARGMTQVARDAGLSRESLYKAHPGSGLRASAPS